MQAVYGGEGTDYSGSTSPVLTLTIGGPVTAAATHRFGDLGRADQADDGLYDRFHGADIAGMVALRFRSGRSRDAGDPPCPPPAQDRGARIMKPPRPEQSTGGAGAAVPGCCSGRPLHSSRA